MLAAQEVTLVGLSAVRLAEVNRSMAGKMLISISDNVGLLELVIATN